MPSSIRLRTLALGSVPLLLAAALLLVWHAPPAQAERAASARYLVARGKLGQISECLYVLDPQTSRLTALRMDGFTRRLQTFSGISIAEDFGVEGTPDYTLTCVLHGDALGLLWVLEQTTGKIRIYGVNTDSQSVERLDGIDLTKLK